MKILKSKGKRRDFEFEIAVNGPNLAKCDDVVNEANNMFWHDKKVDGSWKFVGTSVREKLKHYDKDLEVHQRILNKKTICHYVCKGLL